jgi:acyl dehydratase
MVEESLRAFIEQSSRFLHPVHAGDTLHAALEVSALQPNTRTGVVTLSSTVHNQNSLLVMDGVQKYLLLRKRRPGTVEGAAP